MKHPDISHHHPVTDWDAVESQCDFIITKATEGTTFVDSTLKSVVKECESRKIPYWLYVFLKNGNELDQAKVLIKTCEPLIGKYFVGYVLDIERGNAESNCREALAYIKKYSAKTMIYTMYAQYSKYKGLIASRGKSCAWWEARYGANSGTDTSAKYPCHDGVDLHQYTSCGSIEGISGKIDLNKCKGKNTTWFKTPQAKTTSTSTSAKKKTYSGTFPTLPNRGYFKSGDKGTQVKYLQRFLSWATSSKLNVDGIVGVKTISATKKFQKAVSLTQDGFFGKETLAKAKKYKK